MSCKHSPWLFYQDNQDIKLSFGQLFDLTYNVHDPSGNLNLLLAKANNLLAADRAELKQAASNAYQ